MKEVIYGGQLSLPANHKDYKLCSEITFTVDVNDLSLKDCDVYCGK